MPALQQFQGTRQVFGKGGKVRFYGLAGGTPGGGGGSDSQTMKLTNLSGGDLSGQAVPFLTTFQFAPGNFDNGTQALTFSASSGSITASEMGHRTDSDGDCRLCVVGGIVTPSSFANNGSITITGEVGTGSATSGTAPTWAALLTADTDFDVTVSGSLAGTGFSQSLRDDGTKLGTFYSSPYVACEVIRLPMLDDHRWIEAHVYIFKDDTAALGSGNLVDVAVDLMLICSAFQDATIADKAVTGFDVEMGVATPTSVYDQAAAFTWRRYEAQKLPVATGNYHRSYWWLGKGNAIQVEWDDTEGYYKRLYDTKHVLNHATTIDWSGDVSGWQSFRTSRGNEPFNERGLANDYNMGNTGERDELGPLPRWGIASVANANVDALGCHIYDADMTRGHSRVTFVIDTGTPRFPECFTGAAAEQGFLVTSSSDLPNQPSVSVAYSPDRSHFHSRYYIPYLATGRYSHFFNAMANNVIQWGRVAGRDAKKRPLWASNEPPRANGRGPSHVFQTLACMPDDWDGTLVGTSDWGKTTIEGQWIDYNFKDDDTGATSELYGYPLQFLRQLKAPTPGTHHLRPNGSLATWQYGLMAFGFAYLEMLKIGPSSLAANRQDIVNRFTRTLSDEIGLSTYARYDTAIGAYNGLGRVFNPRTNWPDPTFPTSWEDTPQQMSARIIAGKHFTRGVFYKPLSGVTATIDYTDQSAVIVTFSEPVFNMTYASEYAGVYGTGFGYPFYANPSRTGTRITSTDGCGLITAINSSTECVVDTTVTPFPVEQFDSTNLPFTSFTVTSLSAGTVEVPQAVADLPLYPDAADNWYNVSGTEPNGNYTAIARGGFTALVNAVPSAPASQSAALTYLDGIWTNYSTDLSPGYAASTMASSAGVISEGAKYTIVEDA